MKTLMSASGSVKHRSIWLKEYAEVGVKWIAQYSWQASQAFT
jgi:hypothetical protein